MAGQRDTIEFTVDGQKIAALTAGPAADPAADAAAGEAGNRGKPLIAALPGGTYTARYFDVAGSSFGSFMDVAAAAGYRVVCFDRPGYGGSPALAPAQNTFDRHAHLLADAIAQATERFGADGVFLTGHSIGGMIALMIAAGDRDFRLTGLCGHRHGRGHPGRRTRARTGLAAPGRDRGPAVRPAGPGDVRPSVDLDGGRGGSGARIVRADSGARADRGAAVAG